MRLGAPRDPPGAAKEAHDDTMGAQNDAKGLAKVLLASHADLMVRQGRPLELPEEAPCHPRTPPSTKTQQKPMVFQCFSIRHIALPRHLPSATGPPWDAPLLPKRAPGPPLRDPKTNPRAPKDLLQAPQGAPLRALRSRRDPTDTPRSPTVASSHPHDHPRAAK